MRATVLLIFFGLAAGVALAEAGCRLLEHVHCTLRTAGFGSFSRFYGWGHRPNADGWAQGCLRKVVEWGSYTRINSHGLRDEDIPYQRTGRFRILVLGDSFTEGLQVDQMQTYPKVLQRILGATSPGGVEVINAGVAAWGTDNALLFFREEGWKYHPDLVLLTFDTTNDIYENTRSLSARDTFYSDKPYFTLDDGRLTLQNYPLPPLSTPRRILMAIQGPLLLHSALARLLSTLPAVWGRLKLPPPHPLVPGGTVEMMEVYLATYPPVWQDAWRITRGLILMLQRDVEAHGARFAVAVINAREEVSPQRWKTAVMVRPAVRNATLDPDKPNRLITQFLARKGIPTIATLDAFRASFSETGRPGFHPWDIHWTAAGHELAGRVVAEGLQAQGLVPAAVPAAAPPPGPDTAR